jgi:hypothetical protein
VHHDDGMRFTVHAVDKVTAFLEIPFRRLANGLDKPAGFSVKTGLKATVENL